MDGRNTGSEDCSAGSGLWTGGTLGQRIVVQVAVCGREKHWVRGFLLKCVSVCVCMGVCLCVSVCEREGEIL